MSNLASLPLSIQENTIANEFGVPVNIFSGVIQQESGGNPYAVSSTGAQGLGQLEPATQQDYGVTNPFDPVQNLTASANYLSDLEHQFGSWDAAIQAYQVGPTGYQEGKTGNYTLAQILGGNQATLAAGTSVPTTGGGATAYNPCSSNLSNSNVFRVILDTLPCLWNQNTGEGPSVTPDSNTPSTSGITGSSPVTSALSGLFPSWARVGAFIVGLILILVGLYALTTGKSPQRVFIEGAGNVGHTLGSLPETISSAT